MAKKASFLTTVRKEKASGGVGGSLLSGAASTGAWMTLASGRTALYVLRKSGSFLKFAYRRPSKKIPFFKRELWRAFRGTALTASALVVLQSPFAVSFDTYKSAATDYNANNVISQSVKEKALSEWKATTLRRVKESPSNISRTGRFTIETSRGAYRVLFGPSEDPKAGAVPVEEKPAPPAQPPAPPALPEPAQAAEFGRLSFSREEVDKLRNFLLTQKVGNRPAAEHLDLLEREDARVGLPPSLSFAFVDHESDFNPESFYINSSGAYKRVLVNGKYLVKDTRTGVFHDVRDIVKANPKLSVDLGLGQINNRYWGPKYGGSALMNPDVNVRAHADLLRGASFAVVNGKKVDILKLDLPVETKIFMISAQYNGGPNKFAVPEGQGVGPEQVKLLRKPHLRSVFVKYMTKVLANFYSYERAAGK